jgi:hypothetical protein
LFVADDPTEFTQIKLPRSARFLRKAGFKTA